jgi:hypothetical protein
MEEIYLDLLRSSLLAIEPEYFILATTYEPSGIVRERVFCYELYHQIRLLMTTNHTLSLNGEIDKRGHLDFDPEDRKNPDFVFHIPGTHQGNTLVIEVKGHLNSSEAEVKSDFMTLLTFVNKYRYRFGVFILYNHSIDELLNRYSEVLCELKSYQAAHSVILLAIKTAGSEIEELQLSNIC